MMQKNYKKIQYLMMHPILGTLPEQRYWEQKFDWYNSRIGVNMSGKLEEILGIIGGASYSALTGDIKGVVAGVSLGFDGLSRIQSPDSGVTPRGSYFLEIPYNIIKRLYQRINPEILPHSNDV